MRYFKTSNPLVALKYDDNKADLIRKMSLINVEDALQGINSKGKELSYYPDSNWFGYNLVYDWSTGLDFNGKISGGYILSVEEDYGFEYNSIIECYVEWNSKYWLEQKQVRDMNLSEDELFNYTISIALKDINRLIESI